MQPSLALRTYTLGRRRWWCWCGVVGAGGRSILHLTPWTTTTTALHTQDSDKEENSLDQFISKFQLILSGSKDMRPKPSKKSTRMKDKRVKDSKDPSLLSYQPFTHNSLSVCDKVRLGKNGGRMDRVEERDVEREVERWKDRGVERNMEERLKDRLEGKDGENNRERQRGEIKMEEENVEREMERWKDRQEEKAGKRGGNNERMRGEVINEIKSGEIDGGMNGVRKQRERQKINTGERINKESENKRKGKGRQEVYAEEKEEIKEEKKREKKQKTKNEVKNKLNQERQTEEEEEEREEEEGVERRGGRVLGEEERALLSRILEGVPECQDTKHLQECLRQDAVPGFGSLRRLCAGVSRTAAVSTVVAIRGLAQCLHPHQYHAHLALDYYWASSLCHAGDVEQSLAVLLHLHRQTHPQRHTHPHRTKKVSNITQLVMYRILEDGEEEEVAKAVDFVEVVASELGSLVPALSLWSATFTSPLFRLQQVSEGLVERHPCLVKLLGRRVEGLVERAAWEGNLCLLQRILHLSLCHNLSVHYQSATSALLQLQCDEGDLRGAEETIKFAQKMEVRLTPPAVRRFLALLSRHRRPAPLTLLALKYHPPPARQPLPPPPTPKYRF